MAASLAPAKCLRVDKPSSTVSYFGFAVPGTDSATAAWRIMRMTQVGTETLIQYAGGNTDFDSVWNDRLSYSYS